MPKSGQNNSANQTTRRSMVLLAVVSAYCLLACIGLFSYSITLRRSQVSVAGELAASQAKLERYSRLRASAEAEYRNLADEQARQRSLFSGPEAVEMSMRVQEAGDRFNQNRFNQEEAGAKVDALLVRRDALATRWVPVIALLFAHLLVLLMLSNRALALHRD
jgi:cell division protein FtsB